MTREFAENRICIMMGGRVAEEVVFGRVTTGAGNDIEQATDLARKMVTEWGMSDEIGPLNFSRGREQVFLGRDMAQGDEFSEDTSRRIDTEIRRIVTEQYEKAVELLTQHRDLLELMSEALLEFEALDRDEIDHLVEERDLEWIRDKREEEKRERQKRKKEAPREEFASDIKEEQQEEADEHADPVGGNLAPSNP